MLDLRKGKSEGKGAVAIADCQSFEELEKAIEEHAPIVSYSRLEPVTWSASQLIGRINQVRKGGPLNLVTRAGGLRWKVEELLLKQQKNA